MDVPLKGLKSHRGPDDNGNKYALRDYLCDGYVHGLKYLARKRKFETFFFTMLLLISIFFTTYFISASCFNESSNLVVQQSLPAKSLHTLPFPAITICSETKVIKSFINFTEAYHALIVNETDDFDDEKLSRIEALSQVCDPHLMESFEIKSKPTSGNEFVEILDKISPKDFMLFCKFNGKLEDCKNFTRQVTTDYGVCFTFNMIEEPKMFKNNYNVPEVPYWKQDSDENEIGLDDYPRRALSGSEFGLNVVLMLNSSDLDYLCRGPVQGLLFKIHSPDTFPRMSQGFQRIGLNLETAINIKPEVSQTKGGECHTASSHPLKYFNDYSYDNCISECMSSFVKSKCKCVKFWMLEDRETTNICNQHQSKCANDAINEFSIKQKIQSSPSCNCKPACERLSYSSKTTSISKFDFQETFKSYGADLNDELPGAIMSRLSVYLEDDFYVPTISAPLNDSAVDFIAKIGGVLAFFLGASWISVIEVFYYLARRFVF